MSEYTIERILEMVADKPVGDLSGSILLDFADAGCLLLNQADAKGQVVDSAEVDSDILGCKINISLEDFSLLMSGELDATSAYMQGRLQVTGDMGLAMELAAWM